MDLTNTSIVALALAALVLVGGWAATASPGDGSDDQPLAPSADLEVASATPWSLTTGDCFLAQAIVPIEPEEELPGGYDVLLNDDGDAQIALMTALCYPDEGEVTKFHVAALLLEVPADVARADATHAVMFDAWADSNDELIAGWAAMDLEGFESDGFDSTARRTSSTYQSFRLQEDSFRFTLDNVPRIHDAQAAPFDAMRFFTYDEDGDDFSFRPVFDLDRSAIDAGEAIATVSFVSTDLLRLGVPRTYEATGFFPLDEVETLTMVAIEA